MIHRLQILAIAVLCCAGRVNAQPHVWHYIKTHKELLASDALYTLAWSADAASSVHCQRVNPYCTEQNPVLGPHPTALATWGWTSAAIGVNATFSHLIWHFAPEKADRHVIWFLSAPFAGYEVSNIKGNVEAAEGR